MSRTMTRAARGTGPAGARAVRRANAGEHR